MTHCRLLDMFVIVFRSNQLRKLLRMLFPNIQNTSSSPKRLSKVVNLTIRDLEVFVLRCIYDRMLNCDKLGVGLVPFLGGHCLTENQSSFWMYVLEKYGKVDVPSSPLKLKSSVIDQVVSEIRGSEFPTNEKFVRFVCDYYEHLNATYNENTTSDFDFYIQLVEEIAPVAKDLRRIVELKLFD